MSKPKTFAVCKCIYEKNIFLRDLKLHVTFENEEQFIKDYSNHIDNVESALHEAKEEVLRRKTVANEVTERRDFIQKVYRPLLPDVYNFDSQLLTPEFLSLADNSSRYSSTGDLPAGSR